VLILLSGACQNPGRGERGGGADEEGGDGEGEGDEERGEARRPAPHGRRHPWTPLLAVGGGGPAMPGGAG